MAVGKKILVTDDEEGVSQFLCDFLTDRDFDVTTASNGKEALEKVETFRPSVVLLDMIMPGMGGIECLQQIKKKDPQIMVIMISAIEDNEQINRAKQHGAYSYIIKPFSLDYLESELLTLLGGIKR